MRTAQTLWKCFQGLADLRERGHWSPAGQCIAVKSDLEGNFGIYIIRASGGNQSRLTAHSAADTMPRWSRDGNWIYFASNRSGDWRCGKAGGGGEEIQVRWRRDGLGSAEAQGPL